MENELLTKLYGEFCSMRGEMCEFKNRTLERLGALETSLKKSSAEKAARICQIVSIQISCTRHSFLTRRAGLFMWQAGAELAM